MAEPPSSKKRPLVSALVRPSPKVNKQVVINIPGGSLPLKEKQRPEGRKKFLVHSESSLSAVSQKFQQDESLLHRAVRDAGRWAYGCVFVEMWVLSEDKTCLCRPEAGWWVDHQFHDNHSECSEDCKICRLVHSNRKSFVPPRPLAPGEGLPGVLWAEANKSWLQGARSVSNSFRSPRAHRGHHRRSLADATGEIFSEATSGKPQRRVAWRQVKTIAQDPDQPWNQRLHLLKDMGLGWAAAVPFKGANGEEGIMVYLAREGVNHVMLSSQDNEAYLKSATDFAGAAYCLKTPRSKMERARRAERVAAWRRVRLRIITLIREGKNLEEYIQAQSQQEHDDVLTVSTTGNSILEDYAAMAKERALVVLRKFQGGGAQPSPAFSWRQTFLTFIGVFLTLLCVARLDVRLSENRGDDFSIVMGPFGALVTLLFGLTAAPASQPRNAILGQAVALAIAMVSSYIKTDAYEIWMRQVLVTALAVSAMVRLGITHPPAGASALIFSSGQYDWSHVLVFFTGNVLAIALAVLINNLSLKRQYPLYWGVESIEQRVRELHRLASRKVK